ncbi:hypothetical protein IAI10_20975 [Clostridium sp. 19966]|uniref:hypothetical protein n=1 Tax=Clostridium sp. 19966 TaxID=2768166 RepID=UPI0028DF97C4|nr:hypothetical protein [Clostridium sp. 19966]MDT8719127.1 hypothetical protein [Clostridium sp. 19966]
MARQRKVIDVDVYDEDKKEPSNQNTNNEDSNNINLGNNNLGNIDFNQLASMMQNVDMKQLSSLLGGLGGLGSLGNLGGAGGLLGNLGGAGGLLGNLAGMLGGAQPQAQPQMQQPNAGLSGIPVGGDRRLQILGALRPMVSPERAALIDMVLQIYMISRILKR